MKKQYYLMFYIKQDIIRIMSGNMIYEYDSEYNCKIHKKINSMTVLNYNLLNDKILQTLNLIRSYKQEIEEENKFLYGYITLNEKSITTSKLIIDEKVNIRITGLCIIDKNLNLKYKDFNIYINSFVNFNTENIIRSDKLKKILE